MWCLVEPRREDCPSLAPSVQAIIMLRFRSGEMERPLSFPWNVHMCLLQLQVVDEIYDKFAANKMGIEEKGQV